MVSIGNVVIGNVVNDYGLDNILYTVNTTGSTTMLGAFIGWSINASTYSSFGKMPAVNVTDSAGNLWRQIGISTMNTTSRGAIWVADNPRQTEWVSVALTGWGYATSYAICEIDSVPTTLGAISIDFVETGNNVAATSLTLPTATASVNDIVFGLVTTCGYVGTPLTLSTGWTGITSATSGLANGVATYAYWNSGTVGTVPYTATWGGGATVPSAGLMVGIKQSATIPTQTNPNMPNVIVEACFGATPGDYTQSVDYTWDVTGLEWTNITSYAFSKGDDGRIRTKRGRQYELSQEETGELEILLDNHAGAFTFGNTTSPFYPYIVPGTPIRVTAWWDGTQYPVAFGYAEKWPQQWPEMPQWGFSTVTAVDAYGALASTDLPSAVEGDIRKDQPYAYFPTAEQYEFTSQSLTPTASPLDANGLIAVDNAFGNNRYGAYKDGWDQPVTVGQALNLLGDENTCLGATTYTGQEIETNGPGMFYFDPNLPTNSVANSGFSVEFWFVWGNSNAYACNLFAAFAYPSSFPSTASTTNPTTGGVIAVGVNTGLPGAQTVISGFYCNGTELTNGLFNQDTYAPQHFVLTTGPNGTTTYLNGVATANNPSVGTIAHLRAICLGPARFSYDVSNMIAYDGFNYIAGHCAWYGYELTSTQVSNHFEGGYSGWVGVSASGRFAQTLTWGGLGLKRGGTAWYGEYGQEEGTYISEAYDYQGSSAADIMSQLVQTEWGRCFTQANGSIVYTYRWWQYNPSTVATFGDNGTTQLPFEKETSFAADNQFIYNQVTATQNRGPDQDFYVFQTDAASQLDYFLRSGLDIQSYAMLPFDVFDVVNWSVVKYRQPVQRVVTLEIDVTRTAAKFPAMFPTILGLELNQTIYITRNPVGSGDIALAGVIQSISHDIGAAYWKTAMQVTPVFPENSALFTDVSGYDSPGASYLSW